MVPFLWWGEGREGGGRRLLDAFFSCHVFLEGKVSFNFIQRWMTWVEKASVLYLKRAFDWEIRRLASVFTSPLTVATCNFVL